MAGGLALTYGVELASSWANMMLYMLEIVMCLRYFQRNTFRPLSHKIGVGAIILFDTLCTLSVDAGVFMTSLVFLGKEPFSSTLSTSFIILLTYSTAVIEQFFLCHLYFIITRKRAVSLFLVLLGLIHLGFSFAAAIMLQTAPKNPSVDSIISVGAIICGVTDLLIASCLGYELFKVRRSHNSNSSPLRRIFILSITSGTIVATTTLLMMILFLKGSIAFEFFSACQGRVYALTLLFNFLSGTSSSSAATTIANGHQNGLAAIYESRAGGARPAASIYSNTSAESLNKELPPLPATPTPGLHIVTQTQSIAKFKFPAAPFSLSSPEVIWSPDTGTPRTPRTIIAAPHRKDSLPVSLTAPRL
ncbi:hypothetical protein B0H14DRAFT_976254 [Mycena olivaceomarginata]|nr:hypothetical protein B0H14DRAFT_976254 [Mycena olivaceomarginata]